MSQPRGSRGHKAVRDTVLWLQSEFRDDLDEWRSDQPVRRTVVGVLELVFAVGILIRAGMHVGGAMVADPSGFAEHDHDAEFGMQPSNTIRDAPLNVDITGRLMAAGYALWWVQHPPPVSLPAGAAGEILAVYWAANMGFVLLDPFWMLVARAASTR